MNTRAPKAPKQISIVATMLSDPTGLWEITPERVALLKGNRGRLPKHYQAAADDMLATVFAGKKLWQCKVEYMAALQQISIAYQKPTEEDLRKVLLDLREGASMDGVLQHEWVQTAITFLERLEEYQSLETAHPPLEEPGVF